MTTFFQCLEEQHEKMLRVTLREKAARRLREYMLETGDVKPEDTNYEAGVLNAINWMLGEDNDPPIEMT